jgi:hypothetical protein
MNLLKQTDLVKRAGCSRAYISFIVKYKPEKLNLKEVAGMQLIKDDQKVKDFIVEIKKGKK